MLISWSSIPVTSFVFLFSGWRIVIYAVWLMTSFFITIHGSITPWQCSVHRPLAPPLGNIISMQRNCWWAVLFALIQSISHDLAIERPNWLFLEKQGVHKFYFNTFACVLQIKLGVHLANSIQQTPKGIAG